MEGKLQQTRRGGESWSWFQDVDVIGDRDDVPTLQINYVRYFPNQTCTAATSRLPAPSPSCIFWGGMGREGAANSLEASSFPSLFPMKAIRHE